MKRVVVIGGGVSGLAAAHRLLELRAEASVEVEPLVLEASDRLGGLIATERRDGFVLELGPDSMVSDKPSGIELARRLGLQEELTGTNDQHRRAFVVRRSRLIPVPEGFQLLAPARLGPLVCTPLFSPLGKLRMACELLIPPRRSDADESLGSFVIRRLGREALERIAQPMIAGIYGADPMELSLRATLPRFLDMEREHGSVTRGLWARSRAARTAHAGNDAPSERTGVSGARYGLFVSFRQGMQTLTDALEAAVPAECRSTGTPAGALRREASGWSVDVRRNGQLITLSGDGVIVALPAHQAAALLGSLEPDLARCLEAISYAAAATLTLVYREGEITHPLDGFGFVVPAVEQMRLLGCTFVHRKYPGRCPQGYVALRGFFGGESALAPEAQLIRWMRDDLRRVLGCDPEPLFHLCWSGRSVMPHYRVGHLERIAEIERHASELPSFALAGNAYRGVGIPDSILSGERAAEEVCRQLAGV